MAGNSDTPGIADGQGPLHTYVPGRGYIGEVQTSNVSDQSNLEGDSYDGEEDYSDILDNEDDLDAEALMSANPFDLTKSYNRQRRLNEAAADPNMPKSQYPKTNPQKPSVNTLVSADDQITSLSRHAAKLKLDDKL